MRTLVTILMALLPLACSLNAQSDPADPDSLNIVSVELKMNSGGRRVVHGWSQKRLVQLGDRVSIALLKILDDTDLRNPVTVRGLLPIIRSSFSAPELVAIESDKKPRVTLLLLEHLEQNTDDAELRQEIQQTAEFAKAKTTKTE